MTLQTMINEGFAIVGWSFTKFRDERRIMVLLKKDRKGTERFYLVHSPQMEKRMTEMEFTEPVLLTGAGR